MFLWLYHFVTRLLEKKNCINNFREQSITNHENFCYVIIVFVTRIDEYLIVKIFVVIVSMVILLCYNNTRKTFYFNNNFWKNNQSITNMTKKIM